MIKTNIKTETTEVEPVAEKAVEKFENIKESIKGLYEILKIMSPNDNDIYFKLAQDNIIVLYHNLFGLISNENDIKQIAKKLKSSELKSDIPLGDFCLRNNSKNLKI